MHLGCCARPIGGLLELMRPGDIVTHCFTGSDNTLAENGRLGRGVHEARAEGILFDVGHGSGGFSYRVADIAICENSGPTISTDIHSLSVGEPVFDLPSTMSKCLALGMPLSEVVKSATSRAPAAMGRASTLGAIRIGRIADSAVFDLEEGEVTFHDSPGRVLIPGEPAAETERKAAARGIVVDAAHHAALARLAERGLSLPAAQPLAPP